MIFPESVGRKDALGTSYKLKRPEPSEAFIYAAMARLMVRRLASV
jgi:hypothetical protein